MSNEYEAKLLVCITELTSLIREVFFYLLQDQMLSLTELQSTKL